MSFGRGRPGEGAAQSSTGQSVGHGAALIAGWRMKAVAASVGIAALGYLLVSIYTGWRAVLHGMAAVGMGGIGAALSLAALNYLLRFVRWNLYLRALGHRIPVAEHARIYLTGFALTTTPGKAGEAIRSVFLARHGVRYSTSLAAMFSERISDLVAVLILCLPGLGINARLYAVVLVLAAGIGFGLALLAWPGWFRWVHAVADRTSGRMGALLRHTVHMLEQARRCHAPGLLLAATLLSIAAWGSEAWAFYLISGWLGMHLGLGYAVFVYAASMIAGAVSVTPGGLGGAEAAMVALLMFKGVAMPDAVAATVLIRLATLWFAVMLGMLALLGAQRNLKAIA